LFRVQYTVISYILSSKCGDEAVIFLTTGRMEQGNRIPHSRKGQSIHNTSTSSFCFWRVSIFFMYSSVTFCRFFIKDVDQDKLLMSVKGHYRMLISAGKLLGISVQLQEVKKVNSILTCRSADKSFTLSSESFFSCISKIEEINFITKAR
jgi:hypothetical protein